MKKAILFLLSLLLVLGMVSVSAETSFPLTQTPVTLHALARTPSYFPNQDFGQVENMKEYEKMTGVHIEWENVDPSVFSNTLAAAIASDTLPDIIFKGNVTNELLYAWGDEGILVDLAPYLEQYAPNFYKLMKENPTIEQSITAPNGAIYGLPQVVIAAAMRVPDKMYINTKALEASGKELPKTLDDVYEMLLAMRDADYNANGEQDEVPLMSNTDWLYRYFLGSFGLRTRGAHHQTVDADPVTGQVRVFAQSDNYRKFLEYLHKLYNEKLLYQEIFTEGKKNEAAYSANDRLGVILDTTLNAVPTDKMPDWIGLTWQPEGPDGFNLASEIRSNLHSEGNFCVTDACKNIELAVSWIDYFYSEEGSLFYHAGVKDVNWEVKPDGSRNYTDATLATRTSDMTQDSFLGQFAMWPGGRNPSVMLDNLWGAEYEKVPASTAAELIHYASNTIWPIISWTPEENEIIKTVQADIQSYIAASTAQAIAGEIEITDAWWNEFVTRIDTMGADKLVAAYESALNRIYSDAQ